MIRPRTLITLALIILASFMLAHVGTRHRVAADSAHSITSASPIPTGTSVWTLQVHGVERTFRLFVPVSLDQHVPNALVVMMHGGMGSAKQAERAYGWNEQATSSGFIVAYPNGLNRVWNGGFCCGKSARTDVDDVGFITEMIDTISARLSIDPDRVYATGMSNGAIMAARLACETDRFAAIAPVAGTLLVPCPTPDPVSVIQIHGLQDLRVRFDGNQGDGLGKVDGMPIPDLIAFWTSVDQCTAALTRTSDPVTTQTAECPQGRTVELITIADAGHQWPGSSVRKLGKRILGGDQPSSALDATSTIWTFFAAHPKPAP